MKTQHFKRFLKPAGGSAALLTLLTACPQPPPPSAPPVTLNFRFPDTPLSQNLKLAAIYFEPATAAVPAKVRVLSTAYLAGTSSGTVNSGSLTLYSYELESLAKNPACVQPFKGVVTAGMDAVTVTPETVKTCNVYFTLFQDTLPDGLPTSAEELYLTHDIYSHANAAFTYSFTSPDGFSTEKGSRTAGWSLVRHDVLQPTATPNSYRVTMNSVPLADEAITIRLHEDTNRLISQGLGHEGLGHAGGLK